MFFSSASIRRRAEASHIMMLVRSHNHVGRGTPLRVKGWCWSIKDISPTSWNYPQKRLHCNQEQAMQGSVFPFLSMFMEKIMMPF